MYARSAHSRRSNHWPVAQLLIFIVLVIAACGLFEKQTSARLINAQASEYQQEELTAELNAKSGQIQALETQLQIATASAELTPLSDEQTRTMVKALFPADAVDDFMKILSCENGNHDPARVNVNAPGLGYDLGIAQINSRFHSERVERIFGQPFEVAMKDPWKNLSYAAMLYKQQGHFQAWICAGIVGVE